MLAMEVALAVFQLFRPLTLPRLVQPSNMPDMSVTLEVFQLLRFRLVSFLQW